MPRLDPEQSREQSSRKSLDKRLLRRLELRLEPEDKSKLDSRLRKSRDFSKRNKGNFLPKSKRDSSVEPKLESRDLNSLDSLRLKNKLELRQKLMHVPRKKLEKKKKLHVRPPKRRELGEKPKRKLRLMPRMPPLKLPPRLLLKSKQFRTPFKKNFHSSPRRRPMLSKRPKTSKSPRTRLSLKPRLRLVEELRTWLKLEPKLTSKRVTELTPLDPMADTSSSPELSLKTDRDRRLKPDKNLMLTRDTDLDKLPLPDSVHLDKLQEEVVTEHLYGRNPYRAAIESSDQIK